MGTNAPQIIEGKIEQPARLDKAIAEASGLSRERVKALIADNKVSVGGTTATSPSTKAQQGAHFRIEVPPALEPEAQPQDIPLDVVYEDDHLIVVNKPAGMVVTPPQAITMVHWSMPYCITARAGFQASAALLAPALSTVSTRTLLVFWSLRKAMSHMRDWQSNLLTIRLNGAISRFVQASQTLQKEQFPVESAAVTLIERKWRRCQRIPRVANMRSPIIRHSNGSITAP